MSKWLTVLCTALVWCCYLCSIPAATSMANNETDRFALLAFKAAIVQDPFGALSSWNHSLHYCHWNGILCSQRHPDRVIGITLRSQGLVGSLSTHIGNLSFLKSINLQNNIFHGPIPQEMGRLFRLQTIEFSTNSFGGGIPNNLSRCSKLEWLNLIDNNLTGNIPACVKTSFQEPSLLSLETSHPCSKFLSRNVICMERFRQKLLGFEA
ncbi:hypothetical protein CsSME_00036268 [Camellia sinensis var. sinensis]